MRREQPKLYNIGDKVTLRILDNYYYYYPNDPEEMEIISSDIGTIVAHDEYLEECEEWDVVLAFGNNQYTFLESEIQLHIPDEDTPAEIPQIEMPTIEVIPTDPNTIIEMKNNSEYPKFLRSTEYGDLYQADPSDFGICHKCSQEENCDGAGTVHEICTSIDNAYFVKSNIVQNEPATESYRYDIMYIGSPESSNIQQKQTTKPNIKLFKF